MPTGERLTFFQRKALRDLVKLARGSPDEPLTDDDWAAYFEFSAQPSNRFMRRVLRALPATPRCGFCGAPFSGVGGRLVRPLGFRPSRKNPNICAMCVELAPPGGMTTEVGVLFADLRGFTSHSESITPAEAGAMLRRFYSCAEKVLLPEALIDKLIGDEVMALYLPIFVRPSLKSTVDEDDGVMVAKLMVDHARALLERIGYGSADGPMFEVGIGLDFGEAFVGNIGNEALGDFTAVGDVVNTASRLQGMAAAGEVLISERLALLVDGPIGEPEMVALKGKKGSFAARRVRWFAGP